MARWTWNLAHAVRPSAYVIALSKGGQGFSAAPARNDVELRGWYGYAPFEDSLICCKTGRISAIKVIGMQFRKLRYTTQGNIFLHDRLIKRCQVRWSYHQSTIKKQRYTNFILTTWDYRVVVRMTNDPAEFISTHICASKLRCKTKSLKYAWKRYPPTRKTTPIVTPMNDPMKKILVASFGLLLSFPLLGRRRVQLWMASPEVDEQCIFSSKCRRASWLPATDMPSTTGPAARVMLFHVAVQVPLRVLSCKGGAVCAYQAA